MIKNTERLKGKGVLVVGLGVLGGGVATVKWLVRRGATVTVTDLRTKKALASSLEKLKHVKDVRFVLGRHRESDFRSHDILVVNPGVPKESPYLRIAKEEGVRIENDASLFFATIDVPTIGITGTRGKTTITAWISELLADRYGDVRPSGNTPNNPLLKEFDRVSRGRIPAVSELSSWQLEVLPVAKRAPHIAVITNIYRDHMNRYSSMTQYANAKSNIFKHQSEEDMLILNYDDEWREHFLGKHPKAQVYFVALRPLPKKYNGIFYTDGGIVLQYQGEREILSPLRKFKKDRGEHNLYNLLFAVLAVALFDPGMRFSESRFTGLSTVPFRQEIVLRSRTNTVVNDSAATSPDATISAIKRFAPESGSVFIMGGTDKNLRFGELAHTIKSHLKPAQLILLEGSATKKLLRELRKIDFFRTAAPQLYATLAECVHEAAEYTRVLPGRGVVVLSPGAASFEKFANEFDRGKQFNRLVKRL